MSSSNMILLVVASFFLHQVVGDPIVGGGNSDIRAHPWLASIQKGGYHECVGSIISHTLILTAAHCANDPPSSYIVRVDSSRTDSGGEWHRVVAIKQHEHYVELPAYDRILNDVALMKVSPPLSKNISRIELARQGYKVATGAVVNIAGWGSISYGGPPIYELKSTDLRIVDSAVCSRAYRDRTGTTMAANGQICAAKDTSDACNGDSGGPLVENEIQIGIVSTGVGCVNPRFPGVYTEIARFRSWIDRNARALT